MSVRATEKVLSFHDSVAASCVERLRQALNPRTGLFDRQLRDKRWESTEHTEDLTSTAICLIGIHRAGVDPNRVELELPRTLTAMADATRHRDYPGGLGLVLWANAVWGGVTASELLQQTGLSLESPSEFVAELTTMEVAWLVSGLLHELKRSNETLIRNAFETARTELLDRYESTTRLFRHASDRAPLGHRVRKWVPNFADEIYSVQASAFLALAEGSSAAREVAEGCARRLVELQGELGQWWWHYDPRDGSVAQGFPVYSVHQHAMAPMALMSLAAAGGTDYRERVELSHAWVDRNELGVSLLDREAGTIWRDIEPDESEISRAARHARSVLGWKPGDGGIAAKNLKVNYETRPYEWAWCLFAGAIAAGLERSEHVV